MAPMGGDTVFNCGKHRGQTFQYVVENHKGYAAWCLEQKNMRSQLRDFANYVRKSGIDVSCSQSLACSQNTACSQVQNTALTQASVAPSQPAATFTAAGGTAAGTGAQGGAAAPSQPAPSQPAPSQPAPSQPAPPAPPPMSAPSAPAQAAAATPAGAPRAPAPGQVMVRGMSMGKPAVDPVTPPCKQLRQDQLQQATPSPMPAAAAPSQASPAPTAGAAAPAAPAAPAIAGFGQALPVPDSQPASAAQQPASGATAPGCGEPEAPVWSTADKQLDAFLSSMVDASLLGKLANTPVTRRVAVARLLQARQGAVKNFQAYAVKVIGAASSDSSSTQETPATATQAAQPAPDFPGSQMAMSQAGMPAQAPQFMASGPLGPPDACQLPQQQQAAPPMCSQPGMSMCSQPAASQGAPMMSQMSQGFMPTQNTLCTASQASPMMGMPMQQQPGQMVPGQMGPPPMQQGHMQMGQPMQMPMQGQMAMQPGPYGGQICPQGMPGMPGQMAPQMSPWARVLAHLESKGIAFADIKGCHFDTRRDVLKEVFAREPLARAQAEMDWMKAKMNAVGGSGGSRPPRARSRSRDRMSQGPGRPGGSSGISYIMRH